jgi:hypothetical protein
LTENSEQRGRVGVIPSSKDIATLYSRANVLDAILGVVATKDSNSNEDKYNIGIVQGVSELADEIASSRGVKLSKTIPNETNTIIEYIKIPVYLGSLFVLWIFLFRPLVMRIKNGKQE